MINFTVFDVETANSSRASICALGVIRYENGEKIFEKSYLINPETEFNAFNISIHGICPCNVENAPTFPQIWEEIRLFFSDTVLVAHNARSMDLCALYRTIERYALPEVYNRYLCTYELSKELLTKEGIGSLKLDAVAEHLGVELLHHHDALEDTRACCEILLKLMEKYPARIIPKPYYGPTSGLDCGCGCDSYIHYSDSTLQMRVLQNIVNDIIDDGEISDDEIQRLREWLEEHQNLKGFYPYDKIIGTVEDILFDGVFDEDEQQELFKLLDAFINPQTDHCAVDVCGKIICLSGNFEYGSKPDVERMLTKKGATVVPTMSAKVEILILGEVGSGAWKYGNYGSKYEKARQLQQKGKNIRIMKEHDIIE